MEIKILTDSSAELTKQELIDKKIIEINLPLTLDGETIENVDIDAFWTELIAGKVARTSQPSRQELVEHFENAKAGSYALVCIFMSSKLSGTYEMSLSAKEEVGYEHIYIVDSMNVTVGQKLIVKEALKLINSGLSADKVKEKLDKFKKRVRLYACIDSLKYLARGGRISKFVANLGNLLKLKPIIAIDDGLVKVVDKKIGLSLAMKTLINKILGDKICSAYRPVPVYSCDPTNCERFCAELKNKAELPLAENFEQIGPVIGAHIGPGGFGLAYIKEEDSE